MPSPETAADTIRRAAALIRQRAKFATDGPWTASPVYSATPSATSAVYSLAHPTGSAASEVVASGRPFKGGIRRGANAEHIASWHPIVALAVAESWEHIADDMADNEATEIELLRKDGTPTLCLVTDPPEVPTWYTVNIRFDWQATLAAARCYLSESGQ